MSMVQFVVAGEIIFFLGIELLGTIRLIEPDHADGICSIMNDTLGDGEIFPLGTGNVKVANFALYYYFARADFRKLGGGMVTLVGTGEIIEKVAEGLDAGFV